MDVGDDHWCPRCLLLTPLTLLWEGVLSDECSSVTIPPERILDALLFLDTASTWGGECFRSAHLSSDRCSLVCCWVVGIKAKYWSMCVGFRCVLYNCAILLHGQEHVKKKYLTSRFSLNSELNVRINAVEVLMKGSTKSWGSAVHMSSTYLLQKQEGCVTSPLNGHVSSSYYGTSRA